MPEQLTKYPEITLRVLRTSGAVCAEGVEQRVLTECPAEQFCKLPGGELCVFGLADYSKMTQITEAEWQTLAPSGSIVTDRQSASPGIEVLVSGVVGLLAGAAICILAQRFWRRRNTDNATG